jgi:hypothetical protein
MNHTHAFEEQSQSMGMALAELGGGIYNVALIPWRCRRLSDSLSGYHHLLNHRKTRIKGMVHPAARHLCSGNIQANEKYLTHLKQQMETHRMIECLQECKCNVTSYPATEGILEQMQQLDKQFVEMQCGSEKQCRQIYWGMIPFSELVCTIYIRKWAYQDLVRDCSWPIQQSNEVRDAIKAGIPAPHLLMQQQCLDGVETCSWKLTTLKRQAGGWHQVHLRDCLLCAKTMGNDSKYRGILRTIKREELRSIWRQINWAIDDPSLGAVPFVQREEQGEIVDIYKMQAMNTEIQEVTKQRFDRSMSAPITMTSLRGRHGFLSDVHIPSDVDATTTLVLEEIIDYLAHCMKDIPKLF